MTRRVLKPRSASARRLHFIVQPLDRRENSNMAQPQKGAGRKPATKFANLRKKMDQSKMRSKMPTLRVRKSGNR
jgi:hypothetical protein